MKFYFQYPTDENDSEKPVMKLSQTTPSFKTNGNQNNITTSKGVSMDSLKIHSDKPSSDFKTEVSLALPSLQDHCSLEVRRQPASRQNRYLKISPQMVDRKALLTPHSKGSGESHGEHTSDSLSTVSDEDFSDTDTDDEWNGCEVTEV